MISIGILEDNENLRQSIAEYLAFTGKYDVVFSAGSFSDWKREAHTLMPEVVLLDIHLNDVSGIDIIEKLKAIYPETYIMVITGDQDKGFLLKAIERGANGYLYKPFKMGELEHAILTVIETGSFIEPDVLTELFGLLNKKTADSRVREKPTVALTQREEEILDLLRKGHTYNEMATMLNLSFHTVNHHLKNLYAKTNVKSKSELIVKYYTDKNNH
jgi:DNA-binding NarL/FixJ family response regulator